jgi:hypothetical protein
VPSEDLVGSYRKKHHCTNIGTDEKQLIDVIGSHRNWQRQLIIIKYGQMYERGLVEDVENELGGHFLDLTLALLTPPHIYAARLVHKAITVSDCDCRYLC